MLFRSFEVLVVSSHFDRNLQGYLGVSYFPRFAIDLGAGRNAIKGNFIASFRKSFGAV